MNTLLVPALILSRLTVERWTRLWLIAAIAAIVLRVTAPIEWYTFVRIDALKVGSSAIGPTGASIVGEHEIVGTGTLVEWLLRRQQAQCGAVGGQAGIATSWLLLAIRMVDTQVHGSVYGCN